MTINQTDPISGFTYPFWENQYSLVVKRMIFTIVQGWIQIPALYL